ncbi:MAG: chemotaxis protein CheB, partial [Pyrinomonadaceae bacterium]
MATVNERRSKKLPPVKKPQAPIKSGATRMRVSDKIKRDASAKRAGGSFPIVGVGASAGGLEAFKRVLKQLPVDSGMGFVLVQHLDPVHESALTKLLSKATRMPVREVTNNARVETDHVYVIPPNTSMSIVGGRLKL